MTPTAHQTQAPPLFIAEDLALDFINSSYGVGEDQRDCFESDVSVADWLVQAGVPPPDGRNMRNTGLLDAARAFRANARHLVEKRQAGEWADPAELNKVLALGSRHLELVWKKGQRPRAVHKTIDSLPGAALVPVAEALATLLIEADFTRVRKCESHECTLLFHDVTKSQRRRWCSMAACGNRMKVAAFRARNKV